MSIEWTGGDPDQMAEMGVIGDPIPNGDDFRDEDPDPVEEEWS